MGQIQQGTPELCLNTTRGFIELRSLVLQLVSLIPEHSVPGDAQDAALLLGLLPGQAQGLPSPNLIPAPCCIQPCILVPGVTSVGGSRTSGLEWESGANFGLRSFAHQQCTGAVRLRSCEHHVMAAPLYCCQHVLLLRAVVLDHTDAARCATHHAHAHAHTGEAEEAPNHGSLRYRQP